MKAEFREYEGRSVRQFPYVAKLRDTVGEVLKSHGKGWMDFEETLKGYEFIIADGQQSWNAAFAALSNEQIIEAIGATVGQNQTT
jgi:hypothetical protein